MVSPRLCVSVTLASNLRPSMLDSKGEWDQQRLLSPFLPETLILSYQTCVTVLPLGVDGSPASGREGFAVGAQRQLGGTEEGRRAGSRASRDPWGPVCCNPPTV